MLHGSTRYFSRTTSNCLSLRSSSISSIFRSCSPSSSTRTALVTPTNKKESLHDHFDDLLRQIDSVRLHRQIHTQVIVNGAHRSGFLAARLVSGYSNFGLLFEARKVFETTVSYCDDNVLIWNSIIRASVHHGKHETAIEVYLRMQNLGVEADGFTLPLVIRGSAMMGDYDTSRNVHSQVLKFGLQNNLHVGNELIGSYAKHGRMDVAEKVFDRMPIRTCISWNTLISGFSVNYDSSNALQVFRKMEMSRVEPNIVTWTALLSSHARCKLDGKALELFGLMRRKGVGASAEVLAVALSSCANVVGAFRDGQAIHGYVAKAGFDDHLIVKNSLISTYGKHGYPEEARKLFLEMKMRSIVTWNSLITAFAESGFCDQALDIFSQLEKSNHTKKLRADVVTWSAVIGAFASQGRGREALEIFRNMQAANVRPNEVTLSSVLFTCAELGALPLGREIHTHAVKAVINSNSLVCNGLINMYAKCGGFSQGRLIFDRMNERDLISWNSIIAGYGMHGYGDEALEMFQQMVKEGFRPDGVTFVALLSACGHAGLVSKGRKIFDRMSKEFGVKPQIEHYACMVDLLGRAGLVREANNVVKSMPMRPNACVLSSLLNSSRVHKNTDLAEETADHILRLSSDTAGSYVLLSNIYAASGRWDDSARVRLSARRNGLKKTTGQSWIEIKKKVYTFSAGTVDKDLEEAYQVLEELGHRMETEGYVPDMSFALHNVGEDEKKQILKGHSEKLAIAFGHAKVPVGMPIRVMKNLRVCGDCHTWTKYFSKITGREIIVRDARRFHHFVHGSCSCRDYW